MLFDPVAHEPLIEAAWDAGAAEAAIERIVADATAAVGPRGWPTHPLDVEPDDPAIFLGVYLGAAGVVLGLRQFGAEVELDLIGAYEAEPDFKEPGMWLGEAGTRLVGAPGSERLRELLTVPEPDSCEVMWGSPGLLLVARALGAPAAALEQQVRATCEPDGLWTQELEGTRRQYLGPAHGWAGNVLALGDTGSDAIAEVLERHVVVEDGLANWPPVAGDEVSRLQWCHGAAGLVWALDSDHELLTAGAELVWRAGPLVKGPGLCHGTAGNGFAFLKLFTRTGDARWLERARRFAMHAIAQVDAARDEHGHGRYSLWTGDIGVAWYLRACLDGTAEMLGYDAW